MIELLFGVLEQALKLANQKESTKYLDEIIKLKSEWMNEYNKPRDKRSNADLDTYEQRLFILAKSFIDNNGKPKV
jgi:hypothetical protein